MNFKYVSKNGEIVTTESAAVPISSIEYQYGFGVYETIRVTNGVPYFLKDHTERLMESARSIDLTHNFKETFIHRDIEALLKRNEVTTCNLKILLIGGQTAEDAALYILCLNPLFPDKKLYTEGARCITYSYERLFPGAKTLNMLGSYLAYREAKKADAYEALLVNRDACITEGTRTNFFCMRGKEIISPPKKDVLPGVTQKALLKAATPHGFSFCEETLTKKDISRFDCAFLTSTSSRVMPIYSIDDTTLSTPSQALRELMDAFDTFLKDSRGTL